MGCFSDERIHHWWDGGGGEEALCRTALPHPGMQIGGEFTSKGEKSWGDGGGSGGVNRELAACGGTPGGCQLGGVDG